MGKLEDKIQADTCLWFHNTYPNSIDFFKHKAEANKFKAMGVVSGIPDIIFQHRDKTYFL